MAAEFVCIFPVAAFLRLELLFIAKIQQCIHVAISQEYDIAASSSVAAIRSAFRRILFSTETRHAVAAIACLDTDLCSIDKHE